MPVKVLIVDDEPSVAEVIATIAGRAGYDVRSATRGEDAIAMFREDPAELVITDIRMPGMDGLAVTQAVKAIAPNTQIIVLTGHATMDMAIAALKEHGAFDFLTKPQNQDDLLKVMTKAVDYGKLLRENEELVTTLHQRQTHLEKQNQELLETQKALVKSEGRFRSFVESLQGVAYQCEPDGTPIFYHGSVQELTGYTIQNLVDNAPAWNELIHPRDSYAVAAQRSHMTVRNGNIETLEYRIRHRSGEQRWVREHTQLIAGASGATKLIQGVIFDITGYKELQNQILESRRLDAIATLAGGVAHQFNNALAGLVGFLELLQMDLKKSGQHSTHLDSVFTQIGRMANLTQQLLAYAKGGQYTPTDFCLADSVDASLSLIRNRVPGHIRLETDLPTETAFVSADSTQMQMVLLALVENASEAIEDSGRIRISTRNVTFDKEQIKENPSRQEGRFVCLRIVDEGCGMDDATLKKVFDPFFTTKFIGRGLGLSAVYGIINNHGGWLEIDSTVGKGTDIRIYLPATDKTVKPKKEPKSDIVKGNGATVLVIEDEAPLMRATRQRLSRLDFKPLEATTGQKALELVRSHKGSIDVVLLDMRLPDIDGDRLYDELLAIRPDLKIVLCSGYAIDAPVKNLLDKGALGFLQKPFSLATLSEKLRLAVDSTP